MGSPIGTRVGLHCDVVAIDLLVMASLRTNRVYLDNNLNYMPKVIVKESVLLVAYL